MGTQRSEGVNAVMRTFSEMSDAISIEVGFIAKPVIGREVKAENPSHFTMTYINSNIPAKGE